MQTLTLNLPVLFGDHHVIEVRRILQSLPGVVNVYVSSCFQLADIHYDPAQITPEALESALAEAGYLQEMTFPTEVGTAASENNGSSTYFRHTSAFASSRQSVSFAQEVSDAGRPLWPCPGMGVIQSMDEGES